MNRQAIRPKDIDESFSRFRLTRPDQISAMQRSLESVGQLHPVIVRLQGSRPQLLDGFKRFYAARSLKWGSLQCQRVEVNDQMAKVMILTYKGQGSSLVDFEQAQVVYSLKREHLLGQEEIARLVGKSISWVSRRLSFIERLDDTVKVQLRLGKITPTHGRELAHLPRGKQEVFLKLIIAHKLTSGQVGLLVKNTFRQKRRKSFPGFWAIPWKRLKKPFWKGTFMTAG